MREELPPFAPFLPEDAATEVVRATASLARFQAA